MSGAPAVLRFSRDRRGYEYFYLVEPDRRGTGPARILYWFRSPPGIKIGRAPFDDELKRRIQAQNPGVTFDWPRLLATPIPPPSADVERWRERRQAERAEKAARAARRADLGDEIDSDTDPADESDAEEKPVASRDQQSATAPTAAIPVDHSPAVAMPPAADGSSSGPADRRSHKRRRRRRRGRPPQGGAAASAPEQPPPVDDPGTSNE